MAAWHPYYYFIHVAILKMKKQTDGEEEEVGTTTLFSREHIQNAMKIL